MSSKNKKIYSAQYALATSGANAGNIGWINFGEGFTIFNNQGPIPVVNKLKNGYFVSFDYFLMLQLIVQLLMKLVISVRLFLHILTLPLVILLIRVLKVIVHFY